MSKILRQYLHNDKHGVNISAKLKDGKTCNLSPNKNSKFVPFVNE